LLHRRIFNVKCKCIAILETLRFLIYSISATMHLGLISNIFLRCARARVRENALYKPTEYCFRAECSLLRKGDSIFSSVGKFKESHTLKERGKRKEREGEREERMKRGRFATRLRRIDVRKTRNSLDPGSSCVSRS